LSREYLDTPSKEKPSLRAR